MTSSMAEAKR